jgi:hypothetical protein
MRAGQVVGQFGRSGPPASLSSVVRCIMNRSLFIQCVGRYSVVFWTFCVGAFALHPSRVCGDDLESSLFRVRFAKGSDVVEGSDGRKILRLAGWKSAEGKDGRVVAFPPHWTPKEGRDGRVVARPVTSTSREGRDGRVVARPVTWTSREGRDGREVARPVTWTSREGRDGREVARPVTWTSREGRDGREVARPVDWTTSEGKDGRAVAYSLGAVTDEGKDGRVLVVPGAGASELFVAHAQVIALFQDLKQNSDADEALNVLLYWFINEQDE